MKRAGFFLMLAALFALPLRAQSVVAEPFPPAKFSSLYLEYDEFRGANVSVQLQGDDLIYRRVEGGKEVERDVVHPTGDDWFKFIQAINSGAKLYKWAPKYYYPGQGPSWVVDFVMEDRKFNSEGTNEYPKEGDEANPQANPKSGPSAPFQLFWQAALTLAGKAPAASSK
ncbi:MAG TPA: hypothetical protein VHY09_01265 [Candidatus Methylacidiphilales bacterium]|jgi:hypothetical protein|nr:hypothetical protein [Candidatus Methylacidiphilales bacterium]